MKIKIISYTESMNFFIEIYYSVTVRGLGSQRFSFTLTKFLRQKEIRSLERYVNNMKRRNIGMIVRRSTNSISFSLKMLSRQYSASCFDTNFLKSSTWNKNSKQQLKLRFYKLQFSSSCTSPAHHHHHLDHWYTRGSQSEAMSSICCKLLFSDSPRRSHQNFSSSPWNTLHSEGWILFYSWQDWSKRIVLPALWAAAKKIFLRDLVWLKIG